MPASSAAPIISFLNLVQLRVSCIAHLPPATVCFALRNTLIQAKFQQYSEGTFFAAPG
jgi:hypothetical protein